MSFSHLTNKQPTVQYTCALSPLSPLVTLQPKRRFRAMTQCGRTTTSPLGISQKVILTPSGQKVQRARLCRHYNYLMTTSIISELSSSINHISFQNFGPSEPNFRQLLNFNHIASFTANANFIGILVSFRIVSKFAGSGTSGHAQQHQ